jgi:hypothetical protein
MYVKSFGWDWRKHIKNKHMLDRYQAEREDLLTYDVRCVMYNVQVHRPLLPSTGLHFVKTLALYPT